MKKNKKQGFTLIELLVVVLIIGILSAIALPQYKKAVLKARATEAIINLKHLGEAQERYQLANGEKTDDLSKLDIELKGGFYRYYCISNGAYCYARPKDGSSPYFEGNPSQILFCHGTAEECKPFGTEKPTWATDNYWIVRL